MTLRLSLTVLAILALTACGGGGSSGGSGGETAGGGETTTGGGETTTGGGETAPSPYAGAIASTDVALGETKFTARCGGCHNNGAPALANIGWTAERMRRQIREGEDEMPAISAERLPDADMEAVLAYLVTIGAITETAAEPAAATAP